MTSRTFEQEVGRPKPSEGGGMRQTLPHVMICCAVLHRRRETDVSDIQKLTPALSTPGRDLPRREIYNGLSARAAGRVKDLDEDAVLAKRKELFQKRSISNVRQFGGRKALFLLLFLFAI